MKKSVRNCLLLLSMILVMSSCIKREDFSIVSLSGVKLSGLTKLSADVEVENLSSRNVILKSAEFQVMYQGSQIAQIEIGETEKIRRKSTQIVNVDMSIEFSNPLMALKMLSVIKSSPEQVTVNGTVVGKTSVFKKTIDVEGVELSKIISKFGDVFDF